MNSYEKLLEDITQKVQKRIEELGENKVKGTDFEQIVYEELLNAGVMEDKISHSVRRFPDFVIEFDKTQIGVEVKKTDADKWDIPGGSVYESLKNKIQETFVLMGKFGGRPEARLRKYEECISDLTVTHNPRFHLKLDLLPGEDYLTKNNALDLLELPEGKELNGRIRELLRTGRDTWYTENVAESFSKLTPEGKAHFFIDGVVLFPEVTGGDYSKFAPWMTYKCLVWCSNVRDVFSAGGTKELDNLGISAVMARILERTDPIVQRISDMTAMELEKHWNVIGDISLPEKVGRWIDLINDNVHVSSALIKGNKKKHPDLFKGKGIENYPNIIREKFIGTLREQMRISLTKLNS